MPDPERVAVLAVAFACIVSFGVVGTTLESSVSTHPDEAIDLHYDDLPITEDRVAELKDLLTEDAPPERAGEDRPEDPSATAERVPDRPRAAPNRPASVPKRPKSPPERLDDPERIAARVLGAARGRNDGASGTESRDAEGPGAGGSVDSGPGSGVAGGPDDGAGDGGTEGSEGEGSSLLDRIPALRVLLPFVALAVPLGAAYRYRTRLLELLPGLADEPVMADGPTGSPDDRSPGDPSNAVHRAWLEMTRELDVDRPGAMTPAEWRRAAVEAGMDPEAVATLTAAFREVRYGDRPVTDEHRARARRSVDRIAGEDSGRGRGRGSMDRNADRIADGGETR